MYKKLEETILYHAYPVAAGEQFGYRCFDGIEWRDCNEDGIPNNKEGKNVSNH